MAPNGTAIKAWPSGQIMATPMITRRGGFTAGASERGHAVVIAGDSLAVDVPAGVTHIDRRHGQGPAFAHRKIPNLDNCLSRAPGTRRGSQRLVFEIVVVIEGRAGARRLRRR